MLQTHRLTLAYCRPDDRADFIALEQDPEVMRYLTGRLPSAPDDDSFLRPRGTEEHVWTARRKESGAFVGWFCLWPMERGVADLGYRLRREDWGQGLAMEGAAALIAWGFGNRGYERIIADTMTVNLASRRVLERLGFSLVRHVPYAFPRPFPGTEEGIVEYALQRQNWKRA